MPVSTLPRPPCDDGYKCWLWCDVRCQDPAFPSWDTAGQRKTGDGCIDNIAVSTAPLELLNCDIDTYLLVFGDFGAQALASLLRKSLFWL